MSWTRRRVLASAACACAISGCLGSTGSSGRSLPETPTGMWVQSGADSQNTCSTDVSVPNRGNYAWSGGRGLITPLVVDETVYVVDDTLMALNARTGERQWETNLSLAESPNSATQPAVADEHLLLASDGRLASFDTADGSKRWERNITGSPDQPITVATDRQMGFVFFVRPEKSGPKSELVAFGTDSGDTAWTAQLKHTSSTPAVFGDHVYVAGWTGPETQVLRCLTIDNGDYEWERELEDPKTPPVVTDLGVFIADGEEILVYNHSDGESMGSIDVPHRDIRAIALADEMAFVLADAGLSAISVPDGDRQWSLSRQEGYAQADGLAVGRDTVVAPVMSDSLGSPSIAAFERSDGSLRWSYAITDAWSPTIDTSPVIADGAVFVMTNTRNGVTALGNLPPQKETTASS